MTPTALLAVALAQPALPQTALAEEAPCEPLTADTLAAFVDRAQTAIDTDDLEGHRRAWESLQGAVPCLQGPVATEPWTEFLLGLAVVRYATGEDWTAPLKAALRARPDLPRTFGPAAVKEYEPGPGELAAPRALVDAADVRYFLDGVPLAREPAVGGLHIAQRQSDDGWTSVVLQATDPFPSAWLITPPPPPPAPPGPPRLAARVLLVAGFGAHRQVHQRTLGLLEDSGDTGPAIGLGAVGEWDAPRSPFGLAFDVWVPWQVGTGAAIDLAAGPAWMAGPAFLTVGGALSTVPVRDSAGQRTVWVPQPHLGGGVEVPLRAGLALAIAGGGGVAPPGAHLGLDVAITSRRSSSWALGLDGRLATGSFEAASRSPTTAAVARWRVGLVTGLSLR